MRGPLTIIEFGDYHALVPHVLGRRRTPLKREYIDTGKVKLVFRDFPIVEIHPEAIVAAVAAQCAADQDKYWQYHDKLFREQDHRGEGVIRFRTGDLKKWAADLRLDTAAFNQCLDSARHQDEVARITRPALPWASRARRCSSSRAGHRRSSALSSLQEIIDES